MLFTDVTELAVENPQAAAAIASGDLVGVTFALVLVTFALVVAGCVIGVLQIRVVSRGIDRMTEASEKRDKRHQDAMEAEAKRHREAIGAQRDRHRASMEKLDAERGQSERRHTEAMEAIQRRHEQSMKVLDALIRNTGRRNRPIPAR